MVVPPPLTEKKFVKKKGKCIQDDFLLVLPKSSWGTFKTIFEPLLALGNEQIKAHCSVGLSRDHYWNGSIQEIHDFQGFCSIS